MTPGDHSSGSDEEQPPSEPGFSWGLTPTEPEPVKPRPSKSPQPADEVPELIEPSAPAEPPATEALNVADLPTGAMDVADLPTGLLDVADVPTAAINSADLPTAAMELPTRRQLRMPAAVDPELEGATEVLAAHPVSAAGPEDESVEHDAVGSLFGDEQFVEYEEPARGALVPAVISRPRAAQPPRAPIPRGQLFVISIAAGLVAALALAALFLAGTRIGESVTPAAVATPTPTATGSSAPAVGPLPVGTYSWGELLGGECLDPFDSAWQDEFTVVSCDEPHTAQLLTRGQFDDAVSAPFPEVDELMARTAKFCSTEAVIDYSAAQSFSDLELQASFAATADEWSAGHRDFYCFATRAGDDALTESVAQPQVAEEASGE
ncbi:hypothetical protein A20C1_08743 [marine actinobacterium PHSC20C1]|nr:hypothetical protein A20C1_08743 [marine actinobacterium PHSC20C1]